MKKSNVFSNQSEIKCSVCGKNLMDNPGMSMVNIIQNMDTQKIICVKPCCKGRCDKVIGSATKPREVSGWKDITDFLNPYLYMKHIMSVMNSMQDGEGFENDEAFEDYKSLLLNVYPYVTRDLSDEEKAKLKHLPASLEQALVSLENDYEYLTAGGVFPEELIKNFIKTKKEECRQLSAIPNPAEFEKYYNL